MINEKDELCCPNCKYRANAEDFIEEQAQMPKPELRVYPKDREVEHDDMTTAQRNQMMNDIAKEKEADAKRRREYQNRQDTRDWLSPR